MELTTQNGIQIHINRRPTIHMNSRDQLSITFLDQDGKLQAVSVIALPNMMIIENDATLDSMIIHKDKVQLVDGSYFGEGGERD